jgi:hypothetical protein
MPKTVFRLGSITLTDGSDSLTFNDVELSHEADADEYTTRMNYAKEHARAVWENLQGVYARIIMGDDLEVAVPRWTKAIRDIRKSFEEENPYA